MAHTATLTRSMSLLGQNFGGSGSVTADKGVTVDDTMAAAFTGTLTTRTDNDTGVITTDTAHGLGIGDFLDVWWSGGKRTYMDITAVTSTTISVDLGAGDNLPALSTAVQVQEPQSDAFPLVGDNLVALAVQCDGASRTQVSFMDADGTTVHLTVELNAANGYTYMWDEDSGITNPIAGDTIATVRYSSEVVSAEGTPVKVYAIYDG